MQKTLKELKKSNNVERLRELEFQFGHETNIKGIFFFQNKKGCEELNDNQLFPVST